MAVIKNRIIGRFSVIPNALITDLRVRAGAVRMLIYVFSKGQDWEVNNNDIKKKLGIKDPHTIAAYWEEVIKSGWVTRERRRTNGRYLGGYDYILNVDNPQLGTNPNQVFSPIGENTQSGKTHNDSNTNSFSNTNSKRNRKFTPPTIEDLSEYFLVKGSSIKEAKKFYYFYESKGWYVGKNKMKSWKAAVGGWLARNEQPKFKKISTINYD